ncbi:winged helix-turn-helix transcriptional regulator [Allomuricauda sp. SCSIO 65647]|uniref:winged helix-turn-helix transcriptional regulator n=1 Tax=Allomuricauda sp. SCSIO 65647 TaxID=2908843 RepID=UPI001F472B43|nr:helix-turn-helix domain-containing protein [Muricauda sp. SCSIO 65647]UJH68895.1 helix-turn-helix transcriptional regulator [Muricauda sp. SCSIO 65647]
MLTSKNPIDFRCSCAITSSLDILGDRWILVIIKQMLIEDVETFKDFLESPEAIATNVLTKRLKLLEEIGLITKSRRPGNNKTNYYHLTKEGLELTPVIVDLAIWSHDNLRTLNPTIGDYEELEHIKSNKAAYCQKLIKNYQEKLTPQ